jgi:hypothetical protein
MPVLTSQISTKSLTTQFPPNVTTFRSLNPPEPIVVWAKAGVASSNVIASVATTTFSFLNTPPLALLDRRMRDATSLCFPEKLPPDHQLFAKSSLL